MLENLWSTCLIILEGEQKDRVKASGKFEDYHASRIVFPRVFKNTITSFLLVTNEFTSNDIFRQVAAKNIECSRLNLLFTNFKEGCLSSLFPDLIYV